MNNMKKILNPKTLVLNYHSRMSGSGKAVYYFIFYSINMIVGQELSLSSPASV